MEYLYVPALVLYCFCLLSVELVSPSVSVIIHPGHNVTLQCRNILESPGMIYWLKQVNESETLCIASMYSTEPDTNYYNGFQPSRMEMLNMSETIYLKITKVDISDSGRYFCGFYNKYPRFSNVTDLNVKGHGDVNKRKESEQCNLGEDDVRDMDFLPLVVFLGGVTAVLLTVIIILVLNKIRCDTNRLNS
ncbi:hypothetical protein DPEC_G00374160, partial [Dallia pectoralis]